MYSRKWVQEEQERLLEEKRTLRRLHEYMQQISSLDAQTGVDLCQQICKKSESLERDLQNLQDVLQENDVNFCKITKELLAQAEQEEKKATNLFD